LSDVTDTPLYPDHENKKSIISSTDKYGCIPGSIAFPMASAFGPAGSRIFRQSSTSLPRFPPKYNMLFRLDLCLCVSKQKRHPSLMEGWTPLSLKVEKAHAIVKYSQLLRNFHYFLFLLAILICIVKNLFLLIAAFHTPGLLKMFLQRQR
jgi:hypothetical protein